MSTSLLQWGGRALLAIALSFAAYTPMAWANGACPAIGQSSSCSVLITINPNGQLSFQVDPLVPPYDGVEDVLVGVVNRSGATVYGIQLSGSGIFDFDGDGANGVSYAGPQTSFTPQDGNSGTVNFDAGLANNGFLWFSLEGSPSQIKLASTVTLDPGHGYNCPSVNQDAGAVGATDYPATNPPAGRMHEDDLTVAIALQAQSLLSAAGYKVVMTKTDATSCPTFLERANKANNEKTNLFVSVHVNAPAQIPFIGLGSSALYSSAKSSSKNLADQVAAQVSSNLGVSNRGSVVRDGLAVLKPTSTRMSAIIIEAARLSGSDETILHNAGSTGRAASGIKAGLDAFINQ